MPDILRLMPIEPCGLQLRADEAGGPGVVEGPLMVYGDQAQRYGVAERFDPGSLVPYHRGVMARYMHQRHMPLARLGYTMALADGPEEMRVAITLPRSALGEDTARQVEDRTLDGLSVEFVPDTYTIDQERRVVTHTRAVLTGVGVVDIPSYPQSVPQLRYELLTAPARRPRLWL